MIKTILLATDGSNHAWTAWQYAHEIGRAFEAQLRVVSVVDVHALQPTLVVPVGTVVTYDLPDPEAVARQESQQRQLLESVRRRTENAGLTVSVDLVQGRPAEQILARDAMVDLIAMGHQGHRSMFEAYFGMGSIARTVVRGASRPVLVTGARHEPLRRILVAYDGSQPARRALHWSAELAATMKLGVGVLHVGNHPEVGETLLREATDYLRPYRLGETPTFLRRGEVADRLLEAAAEMEAGLIAMGAHSHSRIREAFLGSVTEDMLQRMDRPLLMSR